MIKSLRLWFFCFVCVLLPKAESAIIPEVCIENSTVSTPDPFFTSELAAFISYDLFQKAIDGVKKFNPTKQLLAICDFTKPSTEERFFLIDLEQQKVVLSSLVAHGRNSGENIANYFSNKMSSYKTSLGFYTIGSKIYSPKHGPSLLLNGLEKGKNDNARRREIIMHGADYVSHDFIEKHGRLGRSQGCPALPNEVMQTVIPLIKDGALLYIHGKM